MRVLSVFIVVLGQLCVLPSAVVAIGDDANGLGGALEDTIVAGVQYGRPPSGKGEVDGSGCSWVPAGEAGTFDSGVVDERVVDGVVQRLFLRVCPASNQGVWVAQVSGSRLAASALVLVKERLPRPVLGSAPGAAEGVVKVGMWLWTDAGQFESVSVTAWLPTATGIVWARTTATPLRLVFSSGEPGGVALVCAGPGRVWEVSFGDDAVSDCMYVYGHSSEIAVSGVFVARWSIVWGISWRSNAVVGQNLGEFETTTTADVTVREIQAVIVG